jgi:hypothetical protein
VVGETLTSGGTLAHVRQYLPDDLAEKVENYGHRFTVATSRGAAQEGAASGAAPRPAAQSGAGS